MDHSVIQSNGPKVIVSLSPYQAAIFDLDGVVTNTAGLHSTAWKEMFDAFLEAYANQHQQPFQPFSIQEDYPPYVDGKPRYEGVKSFLASRGIRLPEGEPEDLPGWDTICALGNIKNVLYLQLLRQRGPEVYPSTVQLIHQFKANGYKTAIVTSSRNGREVLEAAGLTDLFDTGVDGNEAAQLGLKGKPAPDTFLEAAKQLSVQPQQAIIFEDALSGVQAGAAGGFGLVVGIDRDQQGEALRQHGADIVVQDLSQIQLQP